MKVDWKVIREASEAEAIEGDFMAYLFVALKGEATKDMLEEEDSDYVEAADTYVDLGFLNFESGVYRVNE